MDWVALIVYLLISTTKSKAEELDCVIEKPLEQHYEIKLYKHLSACNEVSGSNNDLKENFTLHVSFITKFFNMDDSEEILTLGNVILLKWQDENLKWNPSDYGGLERILLDEHAPFWTPEFSVHSDKGASGDELFMTPCELKYNGSVLCMPWTNQEASCTSNLSNWPYDRKICYIQYEQPKFPARMGKNRKAKFIFNDKGAVKVDVRDASGWRIIESSHDMKPESSQKFKLIYLLERNLSELPIISVIPSLVLTIITLSCLFLNLNDTNLRFGLLSFSLYCHFIFLMESDSYVPTHSSDVPIILLYLRSSLVLTTCVIILTFLLKWLRDKETIPPVLIGSINKYVFSSRAKIFVFPRWEYDDTDNDSEESKHIILKEWNDFVNIINSVTIVILLIVYFVLLSRFIPVQYGIVEKKE